MAQSREHLNFARRTLLKGAAALPLAAAMPAAALAVPRTGDPIFAALEVHQAALAAWLAAMDEETEIERVITERLGKHSGAVVVPAGGGVLPLRSERDVREFCADVYGTDRARRDAMLAELGANCARHKALQAELGLPVVAARIEETGDAERDAFEALISTPPTTIPGLLALLMHLGRREVAGEGALTADQLTTLTRGLAKAAADLQEATNA